MPSKGSPKIVLRIPEPLYSRVMETIAKNNRTRREEPWTVTSWVVDCIRDKLAHQEAARMQREREKAERRAKRNPALVRLLSETLGL